MPSHRDTEQWPFPSSFLPAPASSTLLPPSWPQESPGWGGSGGKAGREVAPARHRGTPGTSQAHLAPRSLLGCSRGHHPADLTPKLRFHFTGGQRKDIRSQAAGQQMHLHTHPPRRGSFWIQVLPAALGSQEWQPAGATKENSQREAGGPGKAPHGAGQAALRGKTLAGGRR